MEWSTADCLNLISVYQQHPILWNPRHSLYSHKDKKQDAWVTIARLFGGSTRDVRKKIDNLLRSYRREKTRAKKTLENENGTKEYVSTWYAYNMLSFLDEKLETRDSQSSTDMDDSHQCSDPSLLKESDPERNSEALWAVEAVYQPEIPINDAPDLVQGLQRQIDPLYGKKIADQRDPLEMPQEPRPKSPSKVRKSMENDTRSDEPLNAMGSKNVFSMDSSAVYGQHVGNKLREYDKRTKAIVEYHINSILFQADLGQYESKVFERSQSFNIFR